jgi:hypothetical protein
MERNLAYLLPENLYRVFNETDLARGREPTADLWDEDGIFIDPDSVNQGPEKINVVVTALQRRFPSSVFKVTSPIQENFGVGRVSWEYGPLGGAAIAKDIDVGSMKMERYLHSTSSSTESSRDVVSCKQRPEIDKSPSFRRKGNI